VLSLPVILLASFINIAFFLILYPLKAENGGKFPKKATIFKGWKMTGVNTGTNFQTDAIMYKFSWRDAIMYKLRGAIMYKLSYLRRNHVQTSKTEAIMYKN